MEICTVVQLCQHQRISILQAKHWAARCQAAKHLWLLPVDGNDPTAGLLDAVDLTQSVLVGVPAGVEADHRKALQQLEQAGISARPVQIAAPHGVEHHAVVPVGFHELPEPVIRPDKHNEALILHPAQQFRIPARVRDNSVKAVKRAFVPAMGLYQIQNFLLMKIAYHRPAAGRMMGENGDPINVSRGAHHKHMPVLLDDGPGAAAQLPFGQGGLTGAGKGSTLTDKPVHLAYIAAQDEIQGLAPRAVIAEISGVEYADTVPLDHKHIGVKSRVVYQQRGNAQVAHRQRYAGAEGVGPFQGSQGRGAALGVMPGQAAMQRQRHLPSSFAQKQGNFRQDTADLPDVVPVIMGEEHAVTGRSRGGNAGQRQGFLGNGSVRAGERAAQVDQDTGGIRAQLSDAAADLVGAPVNGEDHRGYSVM